LAETTIEIGDMGEYESMALIPMRSSVSGATFEALRELSLAVEGEYLSMPKLLST
jgi:hypothetical protein